MRNASTTPRLARLLAPVLLMAALAVTAIALAQAATYTSQLNVATGDQGDYVTDADGRAIYIFLNDTSNMSNCTDDCATNWPPVLAADAQTLPQVAAPLDATLLGTTERADGTVQLTYNGWPLYYYAGDAAAGDLNGQGLNDVWYLLTPQGTGLSRTADQPGGAAAPGM